MTESKTVAVSAPLWDETALANVSSFADALRTAATSSVPIDTTADLLGDGFEVLKDKSRIVELPFIILKWAFHAGKTAEPFVSMHIVTEKGDKWIVNDSGYSISESLKRVAELRLAARPSLSEAEVRSNLYVQKGLRAWTRDVERDNGEVLRDVVTYFLSQ